MDYDVTYDHEKREALRKRTDEAPARRLVVIETLHKSVRARHVKVKSDYNSRESLNWWNFTIDGEEVCVRCDIHSGGVLWLRVGDYRNDRKRRHFPEPKAGFSIDKVTDEIILWAEYERVRKARKEANDEREKRAKRELAKFFKNNPKLSGLRNFVEYDGETFTVSLAMTSVDDLKRVLLATLDPA